jgi:2-C-methyl-D-erythritol 4-phosphate cytidylyltransferase
MTQGTPHPATGSREPSCGPGAAAFVVLAGGSGSRLGAEVNKVYLPLLGRPVISWSLDWAASVPEVGRMVLVARPQDRDLAQQAIAAAGLAERVELVAGGPTRHGSEQAALDHLSAAIASGEIEVVVIHDGARPLAGAGLLHAVIQAAAARGGAVPTLAEQHAWPVGPDGVLRSRAGGELHRVQTPQAFRAAPLLDAYAQARLTGTQGTDTSAAMEGRDGLEVVAVPGSADNLKVTFPPDLRRAAELLELLAPVLRPARP